MKKKGEQLAVSSIVSIILAVIVLVILAISFTVGWENMWGKLNVLGGSDAETVVDACGIVCAKMNQYGFCTEKRNVDGEKKTCVEMNLSCDKISC